MRRSLRTRNNAALVTTLALVIACGGSSDTGPASSGSLAVSVSAPSGISPSVTVSGVGGYSTTLSSSRTLSGLVPGAYVISAAAGSSTDPIVGDLYAVSVTGSPAAVTAGSSESATVTYASTGAAGRLWVANQGGLVIGGYSSSQLAATGTPAPTVTVGGSHHAGSNAMSIAVDASGGMWIADNSDSIFYLAASQLTSSTSAAPTRTVVGASGSVGSVTSLAFDGQGNLWLADQRDRVVEYSAAQLAAGGTVTPNVTLSASFGSIARPWAVAFDAHGNLWVCNYGNNSIASFTPAQIAVSGSPLPSAGLSGSRGLSGPLGIAFDRGGNLWVSSIIDTVVKFSAADLTAVGAPVPSVVITGALRTPNALAFDDSDALWVTSYQGGKILRYLSSQLQASGAPTPSVTISGSTVSLPAGLAFAPHSSALPLH